MPYLSLSEEADVRLSWAEEKQARDSGNKVVVTRDRDKEFVAAVIAEAKAFVEDCQGRETGAEGCDGADAGGDVEALPFKVLGPYNGFQRKLVYQVGGNKRSALLRALSMRTLTRPESRSESSPLPTHVHFADAHN